MSGGHFDYVQYQITEAAEEVDRMIRDNDKENSWGEVPGYSAETLRELQNGYLALKFATIYLQRIDWLVSGDDNEERFHERLEDEVNKLLNEDY